MISLTDKNGSIISNKCSKADGGVDRWVSELEDETAVVPGLDGDAVNRLVSEAEVRDAVS